MWNTMRSDQPVLNYEKPQIGEKYMVLMLTFDPEVGSQFWSHLQKITENISFGAFDNYLDLLFF